MLFPQRSRAGRLMTLLECARPLSSLVAGIMSAAVVTQQRAAVSRLGIIAGLAMCTVTMFGFVINDIFDYQKDVNAGVRRPIAQGRLSRTSGLLLAAALLLVACLLSAWIGAGGRVLASTTLALILYSPVARSLPLVKGAYVAALCSGALYYGSAVSGAEYSWLTYAMLAGFVLGREIFMDSDELEGDRDAGIPTIAVLLGQVPTRWLGACVMILAATGIVLIAAGRVGKTAALAAFVSILGILAWPRVEDSTRIHLSRFSMLLGAVALACG
jgi:4-hydroxybenzoate polyprenyltransferase